MQIPNINRYLLRIYAESLLKDFKHFKSKGVWSLRVGFRCFNISLLLNQFYIIWVNQIDTVKVLIKIFIFYLNSCGVPFSYNLGNSARKQFLCSCVTLNICYSPAIIPEEINTPGSCFFPGK